MHARSADVRRITETVRDRTENETEAGYRDTHQRDHFRRLSEHMLRLVDTWEIGRTCRVVLVQRVHHTAEIQLLRRSISTSVVNAAIAALLLRSENAVTAMRQWQLLATIRGPLYNGRFR